jgi:hypothetical protein
MQDWEKEVNIYEWGSGRMAGGEQRTGGLIGQHSYSQCTDTWSFWLAVSYTLPHIFGPKDGSWYRD